MNNEKESSSLCLLMARTVLWGIVVASLVTGLGCGDQVRPSAGSQLAAFERAGAIRPSVDTQRLASARAGGGVYRVVSGDAIELTMPAIMRFVGGEDTVSTDRTPAYVCRVSPSGTIALPRVGEIEARGRTLSEIETSIIEAYYPKYVVTRPSVFGRVVDYRMSRVSIAGAVLRPGVYVLRSDQMSLETLLMEAGGIVEEGAVVIRIVRDSSVSGPGETPETTTGQAAQAPGSESGSVTLPIQGLNIPFEDVTLENGDRVIVEQPPEPLVTVIGLVNRPGNFPYPFDAQYNLMQAVAFAGGLNQVAEPRYATVYRLKPDGSSVHATFSLVDGSSLADAWHTPIKPGDIVAVEQTPRTRTALFLDRIFRINLGAYYRIDDAWNN